VETGRVVVERVPAEVTLSLRSAVLRNGGPAALPGDDHPGTVHLAARDAIGGVVGVVRVHPQPCPWQPRARRPWQLRGMATDPAARGGGAGRALVEALVAEVRDQGGDLVWCDARTSAVGFYERMDFEVVTREFDKPGVGPHVGMVRAL
jgi:predicted GNAT family N-acyltransferase